MEQIHERRDSTGNLDNSDDGSSSFEREYRNQPGNGAAVRLSAELAPVMERGENQVLLKFRNAQRGDKDMIIDLDATIDEVKIEYVKLLNDYEVHSGAIRFIAQGKELKNGTIQDFNL